MNTPIEYSVLVPVYNSEQTLEPLVMRTVSMFRERGRSFELVMVEDHGTDRSWDIVCELKARFPHLITAVRLARNFGQHNALLCGFAYCRGRFVITIDDDLQIPPEEIAKLLERQTETNADVVYGVYGRKKHHWWRNAGSSTVQQVFRMVFSTRGDITSFRLIRSRVVEQVRQHDQSFVFVDGLLHWYTASIARTIVEHIDRQHGRSGYSLPKLLRLANNLLFNFTTFPLRFVTIVGLTISALSFLAGVLFVLRKLLYDVPVGYTSIIVSTFFMGGVILLLVGFVGEYIGRLYALQNHKPPFAIQTVLTREEPAS